MAIPDLSVVDDQGVVVGVVSATSVDSLAIDDVSGCSGVPLSTSMPTTRTHYTHKTIAPYLWGLLPDDPMVIAGWAKKAQVSQRNICGLLNHVGADAAGAFRYSNDPAALGLRADAGGIPLSDAETAERLRA